MILALEQFSGKTTLIGNSKGIRLDAGFFKSHPEFNGDVKATVLAEGQVLLSVNNPFSAKNKDKDEVNDPVLQAFLQFLEKELASHPEQIVPADKTQLARIKKLVAGVKTD